jgi:hypothetical protein
VASYDIIHNFQYTGDIDTTKATLGLNGVQRPANPGIYRTFLQAYKNNVITESSYFDFEVFPQPKPTLTVNPLCTTVGVPTVIQFQFTPDVGASIGDEIWLIFTTFDGQNNVFEDDLGQGWAATS